MSKRWKTRKRNATKLERSRECVSQFYENVVTELKKMAEQVKANAAKGDDK